jgi:hypothetical protein
MSTLHHLERLAQICYCITVVQMCWFMILCVFLTCSSRPQAGVHACGHHFVPYICCMSVPSVHPALAGLHLFDHYLPGSSGRMVVIEGLQDNPAAALAWLQWVGCFL